MQQQMIVMESASFKSWRDPNIFDAFGAAGRLQRGPRRRGPSEGHRQHRPALGARV